MRYLIIKTSALGDVVQAFPAIEYMKQRCPDAVIDWVVEKKIAPLVRAHPFVDDVVEIDAKRWKRNFWNPSTWVALFRFIKSLRQRSYDAVFDLQGNSKSGIIGFFVRTDVKVGFGWKTAPERINCCFTTHRANPPRGQNIRRDYLFILQSYFKDFTPAPIKETSLSLTDREKDDVERVIASCKKPCWIVCPGSAWKNKVYPEEKLIAFLRYASKQFDPYFIFIAGTKAEKQVAEKMAAQFAKAAVLSDMSLPALHTLMGSVDLVIAMDSFPLHLAGTTKTPTFSFFGPSVSCKYRPLGENHFSFQGSCPYGYTFEKRCPRLRSCPTAACLTEQSPDSLYALFANWWATRK